MASLARTGAGAYMGSYADLLPASFSLVSRFADLLPAFSVAAPLPPPSSAGELAGGSSGCVVLVPLGSIGSASMPGTGVLGGYSGVLCSLLDKSRAAPVAAFPKFDSHVSSRYGRLSIGAAAGLLYCSGTAEDLSGNRIALPNGGSPASPPPPGGKGDGGLDASEKVMLLKLLIELQYNLLLEWKRLRRHRC